MITKTRHEKLKGETKEAYGGSVGHVITRFDNVIESERIGIQFETLLDNEQITFDKSPTYLLYPKEALFFGWQLIKRAAVDYMLKKYK